MVAMVTVVSAGVLSPCSPLGRRPNLESSRQVQWSYQGRTDHSFLFCLLKLYVGSAPFHLLCRTYKLQQNFRELISGHHWAVRWCQRFSEIWWISRFNDGFTCPTNLQLHSISLYYNKLQVDNQVKFACQKVVCFLQHFPVINEIMLSDFHPEVTLLHPWAIWALQNILTSLSLQTGSLVGSHPGFGDEEGVEHIFPPKSYCVAYTPEVDNSIQLEKSHSQGELIFRGCLEEEREEEVEGQVPIPPCFTFIGSPWYSFLRQYPDMF